MDMETITLGERIGIQDDILRRACSLAMAPPTSLSPTFHVDKPLNSLYAIFAFPASGSYGIWFAGKSFGETKINPHLFPSLISLRNGESALVNESFLHQFETVLKTSNLEEEVRRALNENKQIVFTGHSFGSPVAVFATIWLLEQLKRKNYGRPFCVTFGCPLIGDRVFDHALKREFWSNCFINFITRHDIVPRILLAPLSSIEQDLPLILEFFNPKSTYFRHELVGRYQEASTFFRTVMRNTSYVASKAACLFMGCTNPLLETVASFTELSPYRPFGTCVFCLGNRKLVIVKNPESVLQLLFYSLQLSPGQEVAEVAYRSLQEHLVYGVELEESLLIQDIICLDNIEQFPMSDNEEMKQIIVTLKDLGLGARARLCFKAAGELERKKAITNQNKIRSNIRKIEVALKIIEQYKTMCETRELGYYDAFKAQRETEDFDANLKRLELAGMWDEIVEMLNRYELPDDFEGQRIWVDLGTKYRRLVEPLDIANYYRHSKNEDTGPYLIKGRPRRYRYTQRWLEHAHNMEKGSCSDSCFWAMVEELRADATGGKTFEDVKKRVMELESQVLRWTSCGEISRDVFLEESTFVKWWKTLPHQHRAGSSIATLVSGEGRNMPRVHCSFPVDLYSPS